ncbi:MAG: DUF2461 domain-containing protein [Acidimicrobiales bacterium]
MSKHGNGFTATTFDFFADLEANNDKEWFNAHRSTYTEYARDPFAALLEELTDRLANTAMAVKGDSSTMFRINRDVRFSKDKRPYSESVSGLMTPTGTKDESGPLLYLQVDAGGGRCGGGMYRPKANQLGPVRRRMVDEPDDWSGVLDTLSGHGLVIETEDQVKTMPRGFADHHDHQHAEHVRCNQLLVMAEIPKTAFLDDSAADRIVDAAVGLSGLYEFIARAQ